MATTTLNVTGMHCPSCSMLVTMELEDVVGVTSVSCDHVTGVTVVEHDGSAEPAALVRAVEAAGHEATVSE